MSDILERFVSAIERIANALEGGEAPAATAGAAPDAGKGAARGPGRPRKEAAAPTGGAVAGASPAASQTAAAAAPAAPAGGVDDTVLRARMGALVTGGKRTEAINLLAEFGVDGNKVGVTTLPQDSRPAFMAQSAAILGLPA